MIDYCLFSVLLKTNIKSLNFLGERFLLHSRINSLIQTKQLTQSDTSDVILIHKESPQFIEYYWRNLLTSQTKWLIITPRSLQEAIILYKEMRSFGEAILIQTNEPILIIKNIKANFKDAHRQEILLPIEKKEINTFLEVKGDKSDHRLCQVIDGTKEEQIVSCMLSNSMYVYFGETISEEMLSVCQKLAEMKFYIIECVSQETFSTQGFFVHKDFLEKTLIYHLTKYKTLENVFKFNEIKLTVAV